MKYYKDYLMDLVNRYEDTSRIEDVTVALHYAASASDIIRDLMIHCWVDGQISMAEMHDVGVYENDVLNKAVERYYRVQG